MSVLADNRLPRFLKGEDKEKLQAASDKLPPAKRGPRYPPIHPQPMHLPAPRLSIAGKTPQKAI
jgi:hypothetical protein